MDFPLVPDQWPVFDEVLIANPDPLPAPAPVTALPTPPSRSSPRNKNPGHIPRPRNAFMLFRSAFAAAQTISANVEHDNRHITRVIAHCWHRLSDTEKQVWRDRAATEKALHAARYPNYRFTPVGRSSKPVKRNVRRNGAGDVKRCEALAELVMSGKHGDELANAIKCFDAQQMAPVQRAGDASDTTETRVDSGASLAGVQPGDLPPFRSPLLPPAKPPVFEPQTLPDPFRADLASLFAIPPHLQDQPRSIPFPEHTMDFVQLSHSELELPDHPLSLFSWNQPGGFSYYN